MEAAGIFKATLAEVFGGWELVLTFALCCILIGITVTPPIRNWAERKGKRLLKLAIEVGPFSQPFPPRFLNHKQRWILWLAEGCGTGRIPVAPGTFGTLPGLLWAGVLFVTGNVWLFLAGTLGGLGLSVWLAGEAEKIYGHSDPASVVCDEIAAFPVCLLPELLLGYSLWGDPVFWPKQPLSWFVESADAALLATFLFGLFRLFDIWKPWPIRNSQRLPGGWGVIADDVLAALYAGIFLLGPMSLVTNCAKAH